MKQPPFLLLVFLPAASTFLVQPPVRTHTAAMPTFRVHLHEPFRKDDEIDTTTTTATNPQADSKNTIIEQRIAEKFEADENSPDTIDAACKRETGDEEKPDRIFDPLGLWTPHSQNF